jgi:hypothetical protein
MLIAGAYFASASQAAQGTEFFVEYGLPSFLAVAPAPLWFSALEVGILGAALFLLMVIAGNSMADWKKTVRQPC